MQQKAHLELSKYSKTALNETGLLATGGFDRYGIASLRRLHQWYQTGGSDRASMVRQLEFLKMVE